MSHKGDFASRRRWDILRKPDDNFKPGLAQTERVPERAETGDINAIMGRFEHSGRRIAG
jgi:hypothetical protein